VVAKYSFGPTTQETGLELLKPSQRNREQILYRLRMCKSLAYR